MTFSEKPAKTGVTLKSQNVLCWLCSRWNGWAASDCGPKQISKTSRVALGKYEPSRGDVTDDSPESKLQVA